MRIGELARLNNITIDTIRYYISIGLLIPHRKGTQFEFTAREIENLQYIQYLKAMKFSLKEIEEIMNIKRTSNWTEPQTIKKYVNILKNKIGDLSAERLALENAEKLLMDEISQREGVGTCKRQIQGVPIRALPLLVCPYCNKQLKIRHGMFSHKYIYSGELFCNCRYIAKIEKGIIITANKYTGIHDSPDVRRELYKTLSKTFLKYYQEGSDIITNEILSRNLSGKIFLENFVNGYFYLYTHFNDLPSNGLYIIVDKYPETLNVYNELISILDLDRDILYIADASEEYPLAPNCVDVNISFFSCTEHDLYFRTSYYDMMEKYMSRNALIVGAEMDMDANAKSRKLFELKYPEGNECKMRFQVSQTRCENLGYTVTNKNLGAVLRTPNKFCFACHIDNEELRIISFVAERQAIGKQNNMYSDVK